MNISSHQLEIVENLQWKQQQQHANQIEAEFFSLTDDYELRRQGGNWKYEYDNNNNNNNSKKKR